MKRLILCLLVAGCNRAEPIKTVSQIVHVPTPVACPAPDERERLRKMRPVPLRSQPMPTTTVERVSKTAAQLGEYEAPGRWGDQVEAVLDRCSNP